MGSAMREGQRHREHGQEQRGRHAGQHDRQRGLAVEERLAEVAPDDVAHEAGELHRQRVVEAHGLPEDRPVGLRRLRHHERDRVAAHLEDRERDQRHAREHDHQADEPAHHDAQHGERLTGSRTRLLPGYRAAGLAS